MSRPDRKGATDKVRTLTRAAHVGGPDAAEAFGELVGFLLRLTVLDKAGTIMRYRKTAVAHVIGGPREEGFSPLPLRGGRYLGLFIQLYIDREDQDFLKVSKARYQYQLDEAGENWVFRYEYIRDPPDHHPCGHLHVRGRLTEDCLPSHATLDRVHFPTGRVSLEAIIRLLAGHFGIRAAASEDVWWPALFESETAFLKVAHKPTNPRQAEPPPKRR